MDTKDKEQDNKSSGHFQNRLVGVIVFVALGVIFLPDVLDGKKVQQEEQFSEIPLRPEVAEMTLPDEAIQAVDLSDKEQAFQSEEQTATSDSEKWQVVETEPKSQQQTASTNVQPQSKPESKPKPAVKPTNKPVVPTSSAYTLQLGSFNNAANVKGLISKLRTGGFNAYTLPTNPVDGKLTKVFVGPEFSKSKLQSLEPGIKKLTKLKGRIVAYRPTAS
ncbi:cell division protein DedD [Shewanella benthica]|uniref:cell division protein DedD n=1 Tax=Shewanella benthica TaxID=43661 RepID=UPI00187AC0CE|nr:cell division protein DedD [Shewanella benthica]MBE7216738.1 cell division protein DedD [Shewanella benthica]MCL1061589.1 cell division protein DedD [Shewanella benthica]